MNLSSLLPLDEPQRLVRLSVMVSHCHDGVVSSGITGLDLVEISRALQVCLEKVVSLRKIQPSYVYQFAG